MVYLIMRNFFANELFYLFTVPLQEKGQFISIWVRVIVEKINGKNKILVSL